MGDDKTVGDVLTLITIVALIAVFTRPKHKGFDPISLIDGFSTAFQNAMEATYHSIGIKATAPKVVPKQSSTTNPNAPSLPPPVVPASEPNTPGSPPFVNKPAPQTWSA